MTIQLTEIQTRYGTLSVPNTGGDIIGRHLARYGEWGWDEVRFLANVLPPEGARVLDVGAFLGTFGIGLAQQRDLQSLCFVEANAGVVPILQSNVRRIFQQGDKGCRIDRKLDPIVIEAMVAPPDTPLMPGRVASNNLGSASFFPSAPNGTETPTPLPQRAVTLADLRDQYGDFDLIKLDVEGMEVDILRSDARFLSQGTASIWLECNENPASLEMMNLLASWELDVYYFAFPAHNPDNIFNDPVPIFPLAFEAGLLVAPKVRPVLDDVLRSHHCILRPVASATDLKEAMWHTPRWGMREWCGVTPQEMAALVGHTLLNQTYDGYLQPSPHQHSLDVKTEIEEISNSSSAGTHKLVFERLSLLEQEQQKAVEAEAIAAERLTLIENIKKEATEAKALLSEHQSLLEEERKKAAEAEALAAERLVYLEEERKRVAGAESLASERLDLLEEERKKAAESGALALERLGLLGEERKRKAEAEVLASKRLDLLEEERKRSAGLEALASERLSLLEAERRHSSELEESLAKGSSRALDLLAQLEEGRDRRVEIEKSASNLSTQLEHCRQELTNYKNCILSVENSLSWRLTRPLRQNISGNSRVGRWLRSLKK